MSPTLRPGGVRPPPLWRRCDGSRHYVKSVSLLDPPDADRLLELDLETAALDFLALEGGSTRAVARR